METSFSEDVLKNFTYGTRNDMANMNDSVVNGSHDVPLVRQPEHMIAIFALAYGLVFMFALLGNILVIAVIFKDPTMRNVTNYFILNLAIADILVAIFVLPITLLANIFSGKKKFLHIYLFFIWFYCPLRIFQSFLNRAN